MRLVDGPHDPYTPAFGSCASCLPVHNHLGASRHMWFCTVMTPPWARA